MTEEKQKQPERLKVRAAIYARYSSDMQSEDSADDQIARIQYRLNHGQIRSQRNANRIIETLPEWVLKDEAQSGRLAGRHGYEQILDGIRKKSFDLLIVDDLSRLTRSLGNLLGLYEMLKWYEVELISICDGISSDDTSAKTFFTVKGMVNDFSNDIHAERVIRGMEMRVLQGLSCGDYPYGFDSTPTKLENAKGRPFPSHYKITRNEAEAEVVRRIFTMYDLGYGYVRIAKALNLDRIPSPSAQYASPGVVKSWSSQTVQNILRNEKYIGIWRWKKTKNGINPESRRRAAKDRPATDWVSHLAGKDVREDLRVVDQELWDRVQAKIIENKKIPRSARQKGRWSDRKGILPDHPFSGLMECSHCTSNFILISGRRGGYYGCHAAHRRAMCDNRQLVNIRDIETAILNILSEKLSANPDICAYAAKRFNHAIKAKFSAAPARMEQIETELEKIEGELTNLLQFIMTGTASETVTFAIKAKEAEKARLMSELSALRKFQPKVREVEPGVIQERLKSLVSAVKENPLALYPAVRPMFPKRIRMTPRGKSVRGSSVYELKGSILLNGGLSSDFERIAKKAKGEAIESLPLRSGRVSQDLGFDLLKNGVTEGT